MWITFSLGATCFISTGSYCSFSDVRCHVHQIYSNISKDWRMLRSGDWHAHITDLFFIQIAYCRTDPCSIIATFRSEYEYEIEYEYDFSNLVCRIYINTSKTNLVPRASFSTGHQQGGAKALGTWLIWNSKIVLVVNLVLVLRSKGR